MAAVRTGLPGMVKMLLRGGVDVNQPDDNGLTPLGLAARLGRLQCVKVLLEAGAEVSAGTEAGHAPVVEATANKHLYVATMLLDNGADKNVRTAQGLSLMHIAAEKGSQELVKLFLRRGLNVNDAIPADYPFFRHRTPLDFALGSRDLDMVSLLMKNGAEKGRTPE
jgi:ankyrin repeat protein